MGKINEIMVDLEKIEKGVLVDYAAGIKLRVASINNPGYKRHRSNLLKPYLRRIRSKDMSAEQILDAVKPAAAKHLLIGWENLEDEQGQPIEYSYEKALEFFNNPSLQDLYDFVLETAGENEVYRQDSFEESAKKLTDFLEWQLEWNSKPGKLEALQKLAENRQKKGLSIPALQNQPELYEDLIDVWQAFQELNQSRQVGLNANPILIFEINGWLALHDINNTDEKLEFYKLIKVLDQVWLSWVQSKQAEKEK